MPIVQSALKVLDRTIDGSFRVVETHTDNDGLEYTFSYVATERDNINAIMAARAVSQSSALTNLEIARNITAISTLGSLATPTLRHSTAPQNAASLRALYAVATQTQAIMMADYLATLSDVQLQNAFSLTAGQVTTLRTNKLTPAVALAASIRATAGA